MKRLWEIDFLRGIAIIMMITFHAFWDLNFFGFINENLYTGFFGAFQIATASLFLIISGATLAMKVQKNNTNIFASFAKKSLKLSCIALLISGVTFALFPENFIYFGIIHLIAVSTILSIPFVGNKTTSLAGAIITIALPFVFDLKQINIDWLVWLGFSKPKPTFDFFPVFPWTGVMLLGSFLWHFFYKNNKLAFEIEKPNGIIPKLLQKLGRNSMLIYLLHQPILFSLAFIASILLK